MGASTHEPGEVDTPAARVQAAVEQISLLPGTIDRNQVQATLQRLARLCALQLNSDCSLQVSPAILIVAGGTNVGKTSLVNAITGAVLGSPAALARSTKAPVFYVHRDVLPLIASSRFLPGYDRDPLPGPEAPTREMATAHDTGNDDNESRAPRRHERRLFTLVHNDCALRDLIVVDTPDIDSVHQTNVAVGRDLLLAADAVLFCASGEKYNDEACVSHLREALRLRKRVLCVLNKADSDQAYLDFRDHVVAEAHAAAPATTLGPIACPAPANVPVFRVNFQPAPARAASLTEACQPIREAIEAVAIAAQSVRSEAIQGAALAALVDSGPLLKRLRQEADALQHHRSRVHALGTRAATRYREDLQQLPILEFQRVFKLLADALKVPVIDDAYARLRQALNPVTGKLRSFLGLRDPDDAEQRMIKERNRSDLRQAGLRLGEALTKARALAEDSPPPASEATRQALLPATEAAALFELPEAYQAEVREAADRWVDEVLKDLHKTLRERPGALALAKTLKGVVRLGAAAGAVALTGHVGLEDLIIAPAVDQIVRWSGQHALDRAYFHRRRDEFYDRRSAVFTLHLQASLDALCLKRLPTGATTESIDQLESALEAALETAVACAPHSAKNDCAPPEKTS